MIEVNLSTNLNPGKPPGSFITTPPIRVLRRPILLLASAFVKVDGWKSARSVLIDESEYHGWEERHCGVCVVDIHAGKTVAFLRFEDAVQETFAVGVFPGLRHPDLINDDAILANSFILPDESLPDVAAPFR
jgi:hypothetical protein